MTTSEAQNGLYDYSAWENGEGIWEEHKVAKQALMAAAAARRAELAEPVQPQQESILLGHTALVAA
jgi:hypothetical protein